MTYCRCKVAKPTISEYGTSLYLAGAGAGAGAGGSADAGAISICGSTFSSPFDLAAIKPHI